MASIVDQFLQVITTVSEIRNANPKWSEEQVLDYFRLKQDLLLSSTVTDTQTGEIITLAQAIIQNADDIDQLEFDLAALTVDLFELEFRAFGENKPADYEESGASYAVGDYVVNPDSGNNNYFKALVAIADPAGPFDSSEWTEVSLTNNRVDASNTFVAAGYGGIALTSTTALSNINTTWQKIPFNTSLVTTPKDVTHDLANDGLEFDKPGLWAVDVKVTISFDEAVAGRRLKVRAYNETDGAPEGIEYPFYVGRNQGGINIVVPTFVEISSGEIEERIVIQVASTSDTFTSAFAENAIFKVAHSSERVGAI